MFERRPERSKVAGKDGALWVRGYYVSAVGINEGVIKKLVREREDASRITD